LPFDYSIGSIIVQIFLITTVPVILGMIFKAIFPISLHELKISL